jgi:hypothetical protein
MFTPSTSSSTVTMPVSLQSPTHTPQLALRVANSSPAMMTSARDRVQRDRSNAADTRMAPSSASVLDGSDCFGKGFFQRRMSRPARRIAARRRQFRKALLTADQLDGIDRPIGRSGCVFLLQT